MVDKEYVVCGTIFFWTSYDYVKPSLKLFYGEKLNSFLEVAFRIFLTADLEMYKLFRVSVGSEESKSLYISDFAVKKILKATSRTEFIFSS